MKGPVYLPAIIIAAVCLGTLAFHLYYSKKKKEIIAGASTIGGVAQCLPALVVLRKSTGTKPVLYYCY